MKFRIKKYLRIFVFLIVLFFLHSILLTIIYRWVNPPITITMVSRKVVFGYSIKHQWVKIKNINPVIKNCAVAAEDNHFLSHYGFDYKALKKALEERKKTGRIRGASTISQQTAKNVFLWQKQSYFRKILELYFTFLIETFWSKERIMEVYLNVIEMGKGIYGIEAASNYYFGKSANKITQYQAALIIVSLPSPLKFNPKQPSTYLSNRANDILLLSYKIGDIKFDKESIKKAKERAKKD